MPFIWTCENCKLLLYLFLRQQRRVVQPLLSGIIGCVLLCDLIRGLSLIKNDYWLFRHDPQWDLSSPICPQTWRKAACSTFFYLCLEAYIRNRQCSETALTLRCWNTVSLLVIHHPRHYITHTKREKASSPSHSRLSAFMLSAPLAAY